MIAQQVITEIYTSKDVNKVKQLLRPQHLAEDIVQHVFLELYQKPEPFILDLHSRGKLKSYIVKILHNTATYNRTSFEKQIGKETPTEMGTFEILKYQDDERERLEIETSVQCAIDTTYWYKAELLKLYAELGTYKAVSEKTRIPLTSVFKTITEARTEIKKKI